MFADQDQEMDDYILLLILAYFKEHINEYSITKISKEIGCSVMQTSVYIEQLLEIGYLEYMDYLLKLSIVGRKYLANSDMEYYTFDADISSLYENKRLKENEIYCIHEFSKKKWRGSK